MFKHETSQRLHSWNFHSGVTFVLDRIQKPIEKLRHSAVADGPSRCQLARTNTTDELSTAECVMNRNNITRVNITSPIITLEIYT